MYGIAVSYLLFVYHVESELNIYETYKLKKFKLDYPVEMKIELRALVAINRIPNVFLQWNNIMRTYMIISGSN